MGAHLALAGETHAVAFLGLGEDDRRLALVARSRVVRGIGLHRIVAAAAQAVDVRIAHARDQLAQLGILVEEMLAVEAAVGRGVGLEFAVDRLVQALEQHAVVVAREQRIPVRAPQQLDHVPARAGEQAFQLLHDRAVAAHRAVEALQVAIDHEDQVVEPFARGERKAGERFGLIHLAVADERPHFPVFLFKDVSVSEVTDEARLIDRVERPQAHGARRELPERRHQIRMAIRRQPFACGFAPIVREVFLREPSFQKCPRIHAGRRMRLEIHQVIGAEEMVEADFEQIRGRGIAGDVAAELRVRAVGAHHHGERVPAHDRREAALHFEIARELRLLRERDRILVRRVQHRRQRHAARAGVVEQLAQQEGGALAAFGFHQNVEGLEPLPGLHRVGVRWIHAPEGGGDDVGEVGHPIMVIAGSRRWPPCKQIGYPGTPLSPCPGLKKRC